MLKIEEDYLRFEILGEITKRETIAIGRQIREIARLRRVYGRAQWRKRKGFASVRFSDGRMATAEVYWYEAHGVGSREFKIKRVLEDEP